MNPEPGGERATKRGGPESSEHVWFLWSGDASDVIDAEKCIISITKGSGDYLDSLSTRGGSSGRGQEGGDYVTGNARKEVRSGSHQANQVRLSSQKIEARDLRKPEFISIEIAFGQHTRTTAGFILQLRLPHIGGLTRPKSAGRGQERE